MDREKKRKIEELLVEKFTCWGSDKEYFSARVLADDIERIVEEKPKVSDDKRSRSPGVTQKGNLRERG